MFLASTLATSSRRERRWFGGPPERITWVRVGSWLVPLRGVNG